MGKKSCKEIFEQVEQGIERIYGETANIKNLIQSQTIHHQTFEQYKNCFREKEVVLVGAGPTAKYHKRIENAVYVGVNNACLLSQIQIDYLFCQDFYMDRDKQNSILEYRDKECIKFFGIIPDNRMKACKITESAKHVRRCPKVYVVQCGAQTYYIYDLFKNGTAMDIEREPLKADGIIFCALQFILHGHPKKIYIVGCDCTSGFFYDSEQIFDNTYMVEMWKEFGRYIEEFYPDIEVISMNPVGLRGMFTDYYDNITNGYIL